MNQSNLFSRVMRTFKRRGVKNTLGIIIGQLVDVSFDLRYGTDTVFWSPLPDLDIASPNKDRGKIYQATTTVALNRIFRDVCPLLPADAGILDVGSGKGKVLLMAAEYGFKAIRGVEFARELCEIAEKNRDLYFKGRKTKPVIDIFEMDAVEYRIQPDEHVFFFFNPFDAVVLEIVLGNINRSLNEHPRKAFIIFNFPEHREVIDALTAFRVFREYNIRGNPYLVIENDYRI